MSVARVEAIGDAPAGPVEHEILGPGRPLAGEGPLVEAQLLGRHLRAALTPVIAQVGLGRAQVGPVGLGLHAEPFDRDRVALDAEQLLGIQDLVRRIPVSAGLVRAAVLLARMTRPTDADAPALVKEYVDWGAGPRASQYLVLGAKARAAMAGRPMADLDDVKAVAQSVLRHRLVTNFAAEAANRSSEDLVAELVAGSRWSSVA